MLGTPSGICKNAFGQVLKMASGKQIGGKICVSLSLPTRYGTLLPKGWAVLQGVIEIRAGRPTY